MYTAKNLICQISQILPKFGKKCQIKKSKIGKFCQILKLKLGKICHFWQNLPNLSKNVKNAKNETKLDRNIIKRSNALKNMPVYLLLMFMVQKLYSL